jgi:SNF2 family DNA or RNA helicase
MAVQLPRATVRLAGEEVHITGPALTSGRMRLYFRTALGGHLDDAGAWVCPARDGLPEDLLVAIIRRLEQSGYAVVVDGEVTDRALRLDIERGRSFARARAAAAATLGLPAPADGEPAAVPDEATVLRALRELGWNEQDRPLLDHQRLGLMHGLAAMNAANFSVPGAGKTATALSIAGTHLAQGTIDVIVVVGPLSCFRPWEAETAIALPGVLRTFRLRGMAREARVERLRAAAARDLLLVSYQTAWRDRDELERLCRRHHVMLIVDESHRVKRFQGGEWSDALLAISRRARVRLVLSGTPMPQGPRDLWSQFTILWPGEELLGSRASYRARARTNFGAVRGMIAPFMTRTGKEALGIAPRIDVPPHAIELAPLQREVYDLIADRLRQGVAQAADHQQQLAALRRGRHIRLLQAASNPDLLNQTDGFYGLPPVDDAEAPLMQRLEEYRERELPAKFTFALDFLDDLRVRGEKCVVWTSFVRNIDQLADLVRREVGEPVFELDGRVPCSDAGGLVDELDDNRERRIADFLSTDGFAVLVANPAACAESISLHRGCHTALYIDRTYDCARWLQSIDRIHRLGLPPGVQVEVHVAEAVADGTGTIDGLVRRSLERKARTMQRLLEGAELLADRLTGQDTLDAAEGDEQDLDEVLRYLIGETP